MPMHLLIMGRKIVHILYLAIAAASRRNVQAMPIAVLTPGI